MAAAGLSSRGRPSNNNGRRPQSRRSAFTREGIEFLGRFWRSLVRPLTQFTDMQPLAEQPIEASFCYVCILNDSAGMECSARYICRFFECPPRRCSQTSSALQRRLRLSLEYFGVLQPRPRQNLTGKWRRPPPRPSVRPQPQWSLRVSAPPRLPNSLEEDDRRRTDGRTEKVFCDDGSSSVRPSFPPSLPLTSVPCAVEQIESESSGFLCARSSVWATAEKNSQ